MPTYDELKVELHEISEILSKFPASVQSNVFDILIENYLGKKLSKQKSPQTNKSEKASKSDNAKKMTSKQSFTIVKEINLRGDEKTTSFEEFYNEKQPKSNVEFNLISIYYLKKFLKIPNINFNHIYTCYKAVKRKVPNNLKQSIYDASGPRYGYIDASKRDDLKIPTSGENVVEHDLPRKKV